MGRRLAPLPLLAALALAGGAAAAPRQSHSWRLWWGAAAFDPSGVTLSSTAPSAPADTHSALLTTTRAWQNPTISFRTTTLAQLRTGSAPNPWEVGWVMFRFRDLQDYYYFILKPNGYELGKKQGSDAQVFLATGEAPQLVAGQSYRIALRVQGARIRVAVNGAPLLDFVDPHPLLAAGSVGLYEEDSRVHFAAFSAR